MKFLLLFILVLIGLSYAAQLQVKISIFCDNGGTVKIGSIIGTCDMNPRTYSGYLDPGDYVLSLSTFDSGGPGGMTLSLLVNGYWHGSTDTSGSWKLSTSVSTGWDTNYNYDDSSWSSMTYECNSFYRSIYPPAPSYTGTDDSGVSRQATLFWFPSCTAASNTYYGRYKVSLRCPPNAINCKAKTFACDRGYGYNATNGIGTCDYCPAGTFKTTSGNEACSSCPVNAICSSSTDFVCDRGYTLSGTQCVGCSSSQFKNIVGNQTCSNCDNGLVSTSDRLSCACSSSSKFKPDGYTSCIPCPLYGTCTTTSLVSCLAGFKINSYGDTCESCPIGTQSRSDSRNCIYCLAGSTYRSSLTQSSCMPCPLNSNCTATGFTCNSGYEISGDGTGCQQCQEGYFKINNGNSSCSQCSVGTESSSDRLSCVSCDSGRFRQTTSLTKCIACPANALCDALSLTCNSGYKLNSKGDSCDEWSRIKFR